MKTLSSLFILFTIVAAGCVYTMTYTNRPEDKTDAEAVTNLLFLDLQSKNYDAAYSLFSDEFYKVTPKDKLKEIFTTIQSEQGDLLEVNLKECNTKIVTGTDPSADYFLIYRNKHQKNYCLDSIHLVKENGGKLKIAFFHVGY